MFTENVEETLECKLSIGDSVYTLLLEGTDKISGADVLLCSSLPTIGIVSLHYRLRSY